MERQALIEMGSSVKGISEFGPPKASLYIPRDTVQPISDESRRLSTVKV